MFYLDIDVLKVTIEWIVKCFGKEIIIQISENLVIDEA